MHAFYKRSFCYRIEKKIKVGGADGIRTHDLLDAIEARSQLRHGPTEGTAPILASRPSLRLRLHSVGRKQAQGRRGAALLVFVVSLGCAGTDRLVVFVGDPAVESSLQSVSFWSHQAGCPKQGFRARLPDVGTEECFAGTGQDNGSAKFTSLGSGNGRNLKIHEGIMSNIGEQIRRPSCGDRNVD